MVFSLILSVKITSRPKYYSVGFTVEGLTSCFPLLIQEDAADEVAGHIANFVTSLPATVRKVQEEPIPERVQKLLDEAEQSGHHGHVHGHGHEDHSHNVHGAGAGYPDPYGLGHGHGW